MLELCRDPNLSPESIGAYRGANFLIEEFERDLFARGNVGGLIHHRHSATPELALDEISPAQGFGEWIRRFVQRGLRW